MNQKIQSEISTKFSTENSSCQESSNMDQKGGYFEANLDVEIQGDSSRSKTPLRQRYEAEVRVIKNKLGDLESIRQDLGLSRRKMCELLMVDPSAWTRWMKSPEKIPPHIYRSLQWYLALIEKQPEWHPQNSFSGAAKILNDKQLFELSQKMKKEWREEGLLSRSWEALDELKSEWSLEKKYILGKIQAGDQLSSAWKLLLLLNTCFLLGLSIHLFL